jgi:hypothetical protein
MPTTLLTWLMLGVRLWCMGRLPLLLLIPSRRWLTPRIFFGGRPFFFLDLLDIPALSPTSFVAPSTPGRHHGALSGLTQFRVLVFRWSWRSLVSSIPSSAATSPSVTTLGLLVVLVVELLLLVRMLMLVVLELLFLRLAVNLIFRRRLWWHLCLGGSACLPCIVMCPAFVAILEIFGRPTVQILLVTVTVAIIIHLFPRILLNVIDLQVILMEIAFRIPQPYLRVRGKRMCSPSSPKPSSSSSIVSIAITWG